MRKPVVQSVLNWHFALDSGNSSAEVSSLRSGFDGGQAERRPRRKFRTCYLHLRDVRARSSPLVWIRSRWPLEIRSSNRGLLHTGDVMTREVSSRFETSLRQHRTKHSG